MGRPRKVREEGATAVLDNAQEHVNQLMADSPDGIHILGVGGAELPTKKVTGGTTHAEKVAEPFGKMWVCKVVELDLPYTKDLQTVALSCRSGNYYKQFRANTEVVLPETAITVLEDACVVNERRVSIGGSGMSIEAAERMNPGMTVIKKGGDYWLSEKRPRFHVQRIKLYQESYQL